MKSEPEELVLDLTPEQQELAANLCIQRIEFSQGHDDSVEPTRAELGVLSRDHLDFLNECDFMWEAFRQTGTMGREAFAQRRLNTIERILGKETFDWYLQAVREKWESRFAELRSSPHYTENGLSCIQDPECPVCTRKDQDL